jgi:hypothetical protein
MSLSASLPLRGHAEWQRDLATSQGGIGDDSAQMCFLHWIVRRWGALR